jgi:flagellar biosynthesis GTPase FlhF
MRDLGKLEVTFQVDPPSRLAQNRSGADSGLHEIRQELLALREAMGLPIPASSSTASPAVDQPGVQLIPFGPIPVSGCRRLAFAGPPGRGKTTSLVKIALRFGLAAKIPVRIYSAGAHGVGCQEQLARYSAILGVPFQAFEVLESLHLALDGDAWKGLTLIDTPGLSASEVLETGALGRFLSRRKDIETHLVLRAEAASADSLNMIARFAVLDPQRLLFTGLDEVSSHDGILSVLAKSAIPATFAGTGPDIPDGLDELTGERLYREARPEKRASGAAA